MMNQEMVVKRSFDVYKNMRDPAALKYFYKFKTIDMIRDNEVIGSSPPDLFVGRIGYPNVHIGPLVPPRFGDTTLLATPESWVGKTIPEIVEMRSLLIRGMYKTKVTNVDNGRLEEMMKELAIAEKYTSVDVSLSYRPHLKMSFDENSQPFGPSAPLKSMELGNTRADRQLEKAYLDTDMLANTAIKELYDKGVLVSKIQKALSAGVLGIDKNRKFVPTRWSITAVDDTLSKYKLASVKEYDYLDSIRVYESVALDNRWIILMIPGPWEYESMEAWYPNTTWNMTGNEIDIGSSYEPFTGRKTYAEIGGCYYAARLAVSELLDRSKAQAKVIILREVHAGYIIPVGVWNVREHVRATLRNEPRVFATLQDALNYASSKLEIPMATWIRNSMLLKLQLYQRTLA